MSTQECKSNVFKIFCCQGKTHINNTWILLSLNFTDAISCLKNLAC